MTNNTPMETIGTPPTPYLRHSVNTRVTLSTLAIFLASIWFLAFYTSNVLREDLQQQLSSQQYSTVSLVAQNINDDFDERAKALIRVSETITPALMDRPMDLQAFLEQRPIFHRMFNAGVIVFRIDGNAIAEIPRSAGRVGANYLNVDSVTAALRDGKPTVGQPRMEPGTPVFSMTAPIRDAQNRVIGAISGVTKLAEPSFLDKVSSSSYSNTGGYMVVAPQDRRVVAATDKRRIFELLPPPGANALVDRFIQGYEGSGVVVNPVGVEVMASAKAIPVAGWYVAAALPTAEAFAPIYNMQNRLLVATSFLTLLIGAVTWWLVKRQLAPLMTAASALTAMSDPNQPRRPLPITRPDEIGQLIAGFNRLLTTLAEREKTLIQSERELRIAAIAFDCQEGMIVTDSEWRILRTNQSFTRIMGYAPEEVVGKTTEFMRSDRHPTAFYENAWAAGLRDGSWSSELWSRRKNGEVFLQWVTGAVVKNAQGAITNVVITHTDISYRHEMEEQRAAEEIAHRDALVREVHHRIKNSLQGISGMLHQFAHAHPELTDITNQAVTQVRSIASLHGLQGRTSIDTVRLCELTIAIAREVQTVWQTPIRVDIPPDWIPAIIAEKEAVPIALILNELIVNAVKHGGKAHGTVCVTIRKGAHPDTIQVAIFNAGAKPKKDPNGNGQHTGLQLVESLMPRAGAQLHWEQEESTVVTRLEFTPPVIKLETGSTHEPT